MKQIIPSINLKVDGRYFNTEPLLVNILKQSKSENIFIQPDTKESVNKKSNIVKEVDNTQLLITKRIDNGRTAVLKEIPVSKKVYNWAGLQIVKSLFGIPTIPVK